MDKHPGSLGRYSKQVDLPLLGVQSKGLEYSKFPFLARKHYSLD